jgi:hypothetical protein
MKTLFCHIFLIICISANAQLVEIVPDSIASSFTMVNNGLTQVLRNGFVYSQHQRKDKADGSAYSLYLNNPLDTVKVVTPESVPQVDFKVFVDQSKLNTSNVNLDSLYDLISQYKQTIDFQGQAINDLYTIEIPKLKQQIAYLDSLNSKKYEVLSNRIFNLHKAESNYIIADNVIVTRGGWEIGTDTYTFSPFPDDLGYIQFDTWQLEIGQTYKLSFQVNAESTAQFDIWIFEDPESELSPDWTNGRVSDTLFAETGLFEFTYTVTIMNRRNVSLRARNAGGVFTISNLKLEKL